MPKLVSLSLNDGTDDVTFEPYSLEDGSAVLVDFSSGFGSNRDAVTIHGRTSGNTFKTSLTVRVYETGTDSFGNEVVKGYCQIGGSAGFILPNTCSSSTMVRALNLYKALLAESDIVDVVTLGKPMYS